MEALPARWASAGDERCSRYQRPAPRPTANVYGRSRTGGNGLFRHGRRAAPVAGLELLAPTQWSSAGADAAEPELAPDDLSTRGPAMQTRQDVVCRTGGGEALLGRSGPRLGG